MTRAIRSLTIPLLAVILLCVGAGFSRPSAGGLTPVPTATASVRAAQQPQGGNAVRQFVKVDAPVIALTHARVIDGTGAPARSDQTIVIRDGQIAALGAAADVAIPQGATVVDATGKTILPGLVMLHEHLYYPTTTAGVYGAYGVSFIRLYLAGGVTTMRTAGNLTGIEDINFKNKIERGEMAGPFIDATAPYLNGPNTQLQMASLKDADDARRQVNYWAEMGSTSYKAYMEITRAELGAAIEEAHKRKLKVTGHLCSVTFSEAADLGIDDLEHGFMVATDFVATKQPDVCPGQAVGQRAVAAVANDAEAMTSLIKKLVAKNVAITSTLPVFETFTPGRPMPPGLDMLQSDLRQQFERNFQRTATSTTSVYAQLFPKELALERAFVKAGGLLVAGTDPTGGGGVIPGYANQRQIELLVEAGFTPLEAIRICTLNGAKYLGMDARVGSLAVGKQADLMVVTGDPSTRIGDIRNVDTVFRRGVGFDPAKLTASVAGKVGLW